MIEPIGYFFVPVFFVLTGMQVDLKTLADPTIVAVALGVTAAAVAGKLVAGLFAGQAGGWLVGWGMVPRGEVGLIFAMVGKSARRDERIDVLGHRHHGDPHHADYAAGIDLVAAEVKYPWPEAIQTAWHEDRKALPPVLGDLPRYGGTCVSLAEQANQTLW